MPIRETADVAGAERYMREQLTDGNTLAHLVLDRIDLSWGKFRIAMPNTVDQTPPFDFKSGILRPDGDEELAVARVVKSFISDPNCGVLMQETQAKRSDGFLKELGYENLLRGYQDELYWALAGPELAGISDDQMLTILNIPSTNPFSAFFYLGTALPPNTLTEGDLERILTGLVGVAVDALDYRSFLLWWRDELAHLP